MDVRAEILDYINCNETTGALLLTGPWGCGKSYLAKQISEELNRDKKAAVAVISLFGLDSIFAINKRVKDEYISFRFKTLGNTTRKLSKGFAKLAKDGLMVASVASAGVPGLSAASQGLASAMSYDILSFIEVQNYIGNDDNKRKFVVVFDDLERCGISNAQDLLGAINDFVENKHIKVIIVADEEKISEDKYKEYKEKLISRTICMSADYKFMIKSVVNHYTETSKGYQDFLIQNQELLMQVFFESESFNVRTLKCVLADFERIYATWTEANIPTENMKWVLYTFAAKMFSSKNPSVKEQKTSDYPYGGLFSKEFEQYSFYGKCNSKLYSLKEWINDGMWNKEALSSELSQKYGCEIKSPLERFIALPFWSLQQNDIDEGLPQAVYRAYEGELSKDQLISMIGKVHALKENSIFPPVNIDYSKIEAGFEKRFGKIKNGTICEPESHTFIEKSGVDEEALPLLEKIKRFDDRIEASTNRLAYLEYLSECDTASHYSLKGLYVEEFDDEWLELFTKKYVNVNNSIKRDLARSLLGVVYDFDTYSTEENLLHTKENFEKLATYLETMETDDCITKIINKSFVTEIKEKFNEQE